MVSDSHRFLFFFSEKKDCQLRRSDPNSICTSKPTVFGIYARKKRSFAVPKNVARKLFGFGSGTKKFSRRNEKILAPLFGKTRAAIGAFPA